MITVQNKRSFLMGFHARVGVHSSLLAFSYNSLFDVNLIDLMLSYADVESHDNDVNLDMLFGNIEDPLRSTMCENVKRL